MNPKKQNKLYFLKLCLALIASLIPSIASAVIPFHGNQYTYYQPDGEPLKVKLYGNNLHAVAETEDGYTIIRDPKTKAFSYAKLSADKNSLVSSGIRVLGRKKRSFTKKEQALIKNIKKNIRISNRAFRANCEKCRIKMGIPNWNLEHKKNLTALYHKKHDSNKLDSKNSKLSTNSNTKNNTQPKSLSPLNIKDTRTTLVLLVQFPDRPQDVVHSVATIDQLFNAVPYTGFGNATSVKGYFRIQSNNQLEVNNIVTAYFTANNPRSHYTATLPAREGAKTLITEGLNALQANGFDFRQLDDDNNRSVDAISLLYAGPNVNSWSEGLWPHAGRTTWDDFSKYGLNTRFSYQITNMNQSATNTDIGIGTICHEYGHALLSLPDLYAYNNNPTSMDRFCLMSGYNKLHPINISAPLKLSLGWGNVIEASGNIEQTFTIPRDSNTFVKYTNPNNSREYYIAEMRGSSYEIGPFGGSNAAVFNDTGLALYHVNENGSNKRSSILTSQNPNTDYSTPYYILPIEKNYPRDITPWYDAPDAKPNDVFKDGDIIQPNSTPSLRFWSNSGRTVSANFDLYDINISNNSLSFKMGRKFSNSDNTPPNPNPLTWASPPKVQYLPSIMNPDTLSQNNPNTNAPWKETDLYRLAFITSKETKATSNNIAHYNAFVQQLANNSKLNLRNITWKVIGSTSSVSAKINTRTQASPNNNGEPIYLLDRKTLIANNYSDLWDRSINAPINIDENGATLLKVIVATGTNTDGTARSNHLGGNDASPSDIAYGFNSETNSSWVLLSQADALIPYHYYALSEPLSAMSSIWHIAMTATTASDPANVEYYFSETSGNPGGDDSGWQDSPKYIDYGLTYGLQYTYTVKARDKSINQNETIPSAAVSVIPQPRRYNEWASATFPSGNKLTNTNQTLDSDNGGLVSVLEWVLAGDPTNKNDDLTIMPTFGHTPNSGNFTYRRYDAAHIDPNTTITVEYSSDLKTWQTATQGQFINITESNDAFGPGIDKVTLQFSDNITQNKDLFVRLKATVNQ